MYLGKIDLVRCTGDWTKREADREGKTAKTKDRDGQRDRGIENHKDKEGQADRERKTAKNKDRERQRDKEKENHKG